MKEQPGIFVKSVASQALRIRWSTGPTMQPQAAVFLIRGLGDSYNRQIWETLPWELC